MNNFIELRYCGFCWGVGLGVIMGMNFIILLTGSYCLLGFPPLVYNLVQFCNLVPCVVVSLELSGFKGALLCVHLASASIVRPRPRSELPSKTRTSGPNRYSFFCKILQAAACCRPTCDFSGTNPPRINHAVNKFPCDFPETLGSWFQRL